MFHLRCKLDVDALSSVGDSAAAVSEAATGGPSAAVSELAARGPPSSSAASCVERRLAAVTAERDAMKETFEEDLSRMQDQLDEGEGERARLREELGRGEDGEEDEGGRWTAAPDLRKENEVRRCHVFLHLSPKSI